MESSEQQEKKKVPQTVFVRGVQVALWDNVSKEGKEFKTISLSKINRDENRKILYNNSFVLSDIPNIIFALEEVYRREVVKVRGSDFQK